MLNTKLLSVVIPVHNRMKLFQKCLVSVFSQNYSPIEIIVVDDASEPTIKSYLSKNKPEYLKKIKLVRNSTKKGPALSRNEGIRIAKGDYIAFLDSDDIWRGDFSSKTINHLEKTESSITICILRPKFVGKLSFVDKLFYSMLSLARASCFYLMFLLNKGRLDKPFFYMTRLSGMVFKKKATKNILFNSRYKSAEDWEFVYNAIYKNNFGINILPRILVDFTYHKNSETLGRSNYFNYYLELLKEIPVKARSSIGLRLFSVYTNFVIWKNRKG